MSSLRIHADGPRVLLEKDGALLLDVPYDAALEIGRALLACAHRAEETAKAEVIAADQAVLLRAGVPIGLTSNGHIQYEAMQEALYDPKLRRYLPGGIKSQSVVGRPSLTQYPPKEMPHGR